MEDIHLHRRDWAEEPSKYSGNQVDSTLHLSHALHNFVLVC